MTDPLDATDREAEKVLTAYAEGGQVGIVVRTIADDTIRVLASDVDRAWLALILRRAADILAPAASKARN